MDCLPGDMEKELEVRWSLTVHPTCAIEISAPQPPSSPPTVAYPEGLVGSEVHPSLLSALLRTSSHGETRLLLVLSKGVGIR